MRCALGWLWLLSVATSDARAGEKKREEMWSEGQWETPELSSICLAGTEEIVELPPPENWHNGTFPKGLAEPPIQRRAPVPRDALSQREQVACGYARIVHNYQCDLTMARAEHVTRTYHSWQEAQSLSAGSLLYETAVKELALSAPPPEGRPFWPAQEKQLSRQPPMIKVNVSFAFVTNFHPAAAIEPKATSGPVLTGFIAMGWHDRRFHFPSEQEAKATVCSRQTRFLSRADNQRPFLANSTVYKAPIDPKESVTGVGGKDIWAPVFSQRFLPSGKDKDKDRTDFFVHTVGGQGNMFGQAMFNAHREARCVHSYRGFPSDTVDCCVSFAHLDVDSVLEIHVDEPLIHMPGFSTVTMYPHAVASGWRKISANLTSEHFMMHAMGSDDEEMRPPFNASVLKICVKAVRSNPSYGYRYGVPVWTAVVVLGLGPLCGGWALQTAFKTLAVFLLSLYIRMVAEVDIDFGSELPFYAAAYQFLLGLGVGSLAWSLCLWGLSRRPGSLPLPRQAVVLVSAVGRLWPCGTEAGVEGRPTSAERISLAQSDFVTLAEEGESGVGSEAGKAGLGVALRRSSAGTSEWAALCSAVAAVGNLLLAATTFVGTLVLYNNH